LSFSRGAGVGEVRKATRGTSAMGEKEAGLGAAWAESMGAEGAEAPATPSASWRQARASTSPFLFVKYHAYTKIRRHEKTLIEVSKYVSMKK